MGRRAWALDRRLWPARHLHQHFQGFGHRLLTDIVATDRAKPLFLMCNAPIARRHSEMNQTDGFTRRRAAGAGDTCDSHGKINVRMFERAERHRDRDFLADRAECFQL
jgi:hypothetical protein